MKKFLKISAIFFLCVIVYLIILIPFSDINKLKTGYVEKQVKNDEINYEVVDKLPNDWVNINHLPRHTVNAIMMSEDWAFYQHEGVDFNQLKEAMKKTIDKGKKLRGASTISQQVVKNLFLNKKRSFFRKFNELIITIVLEKQLPKKKILEIYLNIIEYGVNLYGIHDASYFYFKKPPSQLEIKESAFLAMLIPNPKKYAQSYRAKTLTPYARKTINSILEKLESVNLIDESKYLELKEQPLDFEKRKEVNEEAAAGIPGTEEKSNEDSLDFSKQKKYQGAGNKQIKVNTKKADDFEESYRNDPELMVDDNLLNDDGAVNRNLEKVDTEFQVE